MFKRTLTTAALVALASTAHADTYDIDLGSNEKGTYRARLLDDRNPRAPVYEMHSTLPNGQSATIFLEFLCDDETFAMLRGQTFDVDGSKMLDYPVPHPEYMPFDTTNETQRILIEEGCE